MWEKDGVGGKTRRGKARGTIHKGPPLTTNENSAEGGKGYFPNSSLQGARSRLMDAKIR